MDKKKTLIFSIIGAVVLIILIIAVVLVTKKSSTNSTTNNPTSDNSAQQQVYSLSPSDIGLSLSAITTGKYAGNGVDMTISKLDGITAIDYELSYTSTGGIPRGAIGHIDVTSAGTPIDQQLYFGTCSDVCHPDSGVSNIKITLKITKTDGKIYQVIQNYNPPANQ